MCRSISSAFFAAAFPLPVLRTAFDNFLVFEAGDVRRFAGVLTLDFFELLL
jgi:hypothetical protein